MSVSQNADGFTFVPIHDASSQKCSICPSTLREIGLEIASYLKISTASFDVICQAWPTDRIPAHNICYCDIVRKKKNTNRCKNNLSKTAIYCMHTTVAKCIKLTVIVENYQSIRQMKFYLQNCPGRIENMCKNLMQKFCVAKDYTVHLNNINLAKLYGIHCILINSCDSEDYEGFLVDKQTECSVLNIMTKERFSQNFYQKSPDIGGLQKEADELSEILKIPFQCKSLLSAEIRKVLPKGVLLRGPAGTGKTSLVKTVGYECKAYIITVNGPEVFGARPGETEENLNKLLDKCLLFSEEGPTILFLDEIDTLCPDKRHSEGEKDVNASRILMDFFDKITGNDNIMVIGATNRPSSIDVGLRRPGRFDKEVMINVPNQSQRADILRKITQSLPLAQGVNLNQLAFLTNGYVGADLVSVCREAALMVLLDGDKDIQQAKEISMKQFEIAVRKVMPSIKKGTVGLVELSPVYWSQIGGLSEIKTQIKQAVEWPIKHPEAFQRMGLPCPKGVLLYGPPGCCKTTLVRAAATETNATFIALNGAQIYSPYIGDSERLIGEVFQKARAAAPSIIFLDEIDSIVGKRSEGTSNRGVQERILAMLLNEMDGIGIRMDDKIHSTEKVFEGDKHDLKEESTITFKVENRNVLLVAATNRPDLIDNALIRPGRIDRILYVPPPDNEARLGILKVFTDKMPLEGVDLVSISENTELFSGADLQNLCREAALLALTDNLQADRVTMEHFRQALSMLEPSLTTAMIEKYNTMVIK